MPGKAKTFREAMEEPEPSPMRSILVVGRQDGCDCGCGLGPHLLISPSHGKSTLLTSRKGAEAFLDLVRQAVDHVWPEGAE